MYVTLFFFDININLLIFKFDKANIFTNLCKNIYLIVLPSRYFHPITSIKTISTIIYRHFFGGDNNFFWRGYSILQQSRQITPIKPPFFGVVVIFV